MAAESEVIDWEDALQQCGDDEEFLRELLDDLRTETQTQLTNINAVVQNPQDAPFHRIMRSAHVIKGAAANLMCGQLRTAAAQLETAASKAHEEGAQLTAESRTAVQTRHQEMQQAAQNYLAFLSSIGV